MSFFIVVLRIFIHLFEMKAFRPVPRNLNNKERETRVRKEILSLFPDKRLHGKISISNFDFD